MAGSLSINGSSARAPHRRSLRAAGVRVPTYRVLLVSDHAAAAEALRAHLSRHGFTIAAHECTDRGAAAAAEREHPDLALIDAAVPGGWQSVVDALDGIIARDHVAVLSAYWSTDARREAARTGIGATLLKRVEGADLIERLRALAEAT